MVTCSLTRVTDGQQSAAAQLNQLIDCLETILDYLNELACDSDPEDVADTPSAGSSTKYSRCDHVHRGVHRIVAGDGIEISPTTGYGDVTVTAKEVAGGVGWKPILEFYKYFSYGSYASNYRMITYDLDGHRWGLTETVIEYGTGKCSDYEKKLKYQLMDMDGAAGYVWYVERSLTDTSTTCVVGDWSAPGEWTDFVIGRDDHLYWLGELQAISGYRYAVYDLGDVDNLDPDHPVLKWSGNILIEALTITPTGQLYIYDGNNNKVLRIISQSEAVGYYCTTYPSGTAMASDVNGNIIIHNGYFLVRHRCTGDYEDDVIAYARFPGIGRFSYARLMYDPYLNCVVAPSWCYNTTEVVIYKVNLPRLP